MVIKKNSKKLHTNLNKCQVENCPALPERNLISTCNRRVRSVTAGRGEISFRDRAITTLLLCTFKILKAIYCKNRIYSYNHYGYKYINKLRSNLKKEKCYMIAIATVIIKEMKKRLIRYIYLIKIFTSLTCLFKDGFSHVMRIASLIALIYKMWRSL